MPYIIYVYILKLQHIESKTGKIIYTFEFEKKY